MHTGAKAIGRSHEAEAKSRRDQEAGEERKSDLSGSRHSRERSVVQP